MTKRSHLNLLTAKRWGINWSKTTKKFNAIPFRPNANAVDTASQMKDETISFGTNAKSDVLNRWPTAGTFSFHFTDSEMTSKPEMVPCSNLCQFYFLLCKMNLHNYCNCSCSFGLCRFLNVPLTLGLQLALITTGIPSVSNNPDSKCQIEIIRFLSQE